MLTDTVLLSETLFESTSDDVDADALLENKLKCVSLYECVPFVAIIIAGQSSRDPRRPCVSIAHF